MRGLHPLDRMIGTEWPALGSDADVRAFEATPYAERIAATQHLRGAAPRRRPRPGCRGAAVPAERRSGREPAARQPPRVLRPPDAGRQHAARPRRRPGRRRQPAAAAVAAELLRAVRRRGGRHREPGQSAARGRPDRRHPARREDEGADRARPAAGHRHLEQGRTHPRPAAGPEGDRRRPRRGRSRPTASMRSTRWPMRSPPIAWSAAGRSRPTTTAAYFHTGGTTGMPKLVRHTPCEPGLPGLGRRR